MCLSVMCTFKHRMADNLHDDFPMSLPEKFNQNSRFEMVASVESITWYIENAKFETFNVRNNRRPLCIKS